MAITLCELLRIHIIHICTFCRISVVLESRRPSQGEGVPTPCTPSPNLPLSWTLFFLTFTPYFPYKTDISLRWTLYLVLVPKVSVLERTDYIWLDLTVVTVITYAAESTIFNTHRLLEGSNAKP